MSMHDIEGVVESSVYCIDRSNLPLEKKRNLLYNLYKFQAEYDTGYTNFRVKDILLKHHYMFALPIETHPEYGERKVEFDSYAEKSSSEWLTNDSFFEKEGENSPPLFYVDAGSETWKKLVENKVLTNEQALPVKDIPIVEVVYEVVRLCSEQQDAYCAAEWFRTTFFYLLNETTDEDTPTLNALAEVFFSKPVLQAARNDYYFNSWMEGFEREFEEDEIRPTTKLWLKTYKDWEVERELDPLVHLDQTIYEFRNRNVEKAFESCRKGLAIAPYNAYLLLYEAILSIISIQKEKQDIESYKPWLERLESLQTIGSESEENARTIKSHALYYTAYVHLACGNLAEAKKIAIELTDNHRMPEAEELIRYIQTIENKNSNP